MGFSTKDVYKSGNALKAEDLQKKKWPLTIKDVALAEIPDAGRTKRMLELSFTETEKTLLLNKTNATSIEYIYGPDTDGWLGKQLTLYPTMVDFQGRSVEAIRIEMPMETAAPQSAEQAFSEAREDLDDIPF